MTNPKTRDAFDLTQEDDKTRDRYGRNSWGQQLLMARRLVEAGVEVMTTSLSGPTMRSRRQLGRSRGQSSHLRCHAIRAAAYDQAVSALIEDIYARGLDKRVLVVVTGEFGRTPQDRVFT